MTELISIPISYFEVILEFERPSVRLWMDRATVFQEIFDALSPWSPKVDDVDILTTGKPSEQGIKIKLPSKRVSFFFGPSSCKFTKDDAAWEGAGEIAQILDVAVSTLLRLTGLVIASRKTLIALHFQPQTTSFMQILGPFVPAALKGLEEEAVKTMATVVKWDKRKVTIDGSGQLANGVFLRFEREFDGNAGYDEMSLQLRDDELALFQILGVQEDRQ